MSGAFRLVPLLFLFALAGSTAAAQTSSPANQGKSLGDLARELRGNKKAENPCPPSTPCDRTLSPLRTMPGQTAENEQQYRLNIQSLVMRQAFAELDDAAANARSSQDRVSGGAWKLYMLYQAAAQSLAGNRATESDFLERLSVLQKWAAARPTSITARIALAECYRNYAWATRGEGYAGTVSDDAWKLFGTRLSQSYKTLVDAEQLPAKCPHWYFVMLELARDLGLPKEQTRELFGRAVSFEPSYYHYYRERTLSLLPRWSGEPGDAEAFAEETLRRIGGQQGAFLYFEIATVLYCLGADRPTEPTLSWPKIQEGFAAMEAQYGATNLKLNRFAYLARLYHDREVARRILTRVDDKWEPEIWDKRANFDLAKTWAGLAIPLGSTSSSRQ